MPTLFAVIVDEASLLGIAAIISALGGVVSTILALRKSRNEEYEHALEQLKMTRAEAEALAAELHDAKMKHPEDFPPSPPKEESDESK